MEQPNSTPDGVMFMLGEIRADLKYLVQERHKQGARMDDIEAAHIAVHAEHASRISTLEHFKTRIGVITAALGVVVPTVVTVVATQIGII